MWRSQGNIVRGVTEGELKWDLGPVGTRTEHLQVKMLPQDYR